MQKLTLLLDTNIIIGLEDNKAVDPAYAALLEAAGKFDVGIYIHRAAYDDVNRDKNVQRRYISITKLDKFPKVEPNSGATREKLQDLFGALRKDNDVVDATLLHCLYIGAIDFLVTQDSGIHKRAQSHPVIRERVLRVVDALEAIHSYFTESDSSQVRYVEEVTANTIDVDDPIFESLREDYPDFDFWWKDKCVRTHRPCWVVNNDGIAGIVVLKDEDKPPTELNTSATKILKLCTFKVSPENRGIKLGELLLKKVFWHAQINDYHLVYLTTYPDQESLISLLEYYGFTQVYKNENNELVYEKTFSRDTLVSTKENDDFVNCRLNYPRFVTNSTTRGFVIPIRENYHDTLFPELFSPEQLDLFGTINLNGGPKTPGNTIRKVYLCRAKSKLGPPGSILFFYKGKSINSPSQAMTAVGIFENYFEAKSTSSVRQQIGRRSVYSEEKIVSFNATEQQPIKVINFLLMGYINPPLDLEMLIEQDIFKKHPPQSISKITSGNLDTLLGSLNMGFMHKIKS